MKSTQIFPRGKPGFEARKACVLSTKRHYSHPLEALYHDGECWHILYWHTQRKQVSIKQHALKYNSYSTNPPHEVPYRHSPHGISTVNSMGNYPIAKSFCIFTIYTNHVSVQRAPCIHSPSSLSIVSGSSGVYSCGRCGLGFVAAKRQ